MPYRKIRTDLEIEQSIKFDQGMIIVLFRGSPQNPWPIYGYFSIRTFTQVLQFLAESLTEDQPECEMEYPVAPSRFTEELLDNYNNLHPGKQLPPKCLDNPALTLTINSSSKMTPQPPKDRFVDLDYNGESYWISSPPDQTDKQFQSVWVNPSPARWDKEVFSMLYDIYEFNRTEPAVPPPAVTIAK